MRSEPFDDLKRVRPFASTIDNADPDQTYTKEEILAARADD